MLIDCKRIFKMLLNKSGIFVAILILFSVGGYLKVQYIDDDTISYVANAKVLVVQESVKEIGQVSDNASRIQPVYDTTELLKSNKFLGEVCDKAEVDLTASELKSSVQVQQLTPTRVVDIKITRDNEEEVKKITRAFLSSTEEYLEKIIPGVNIENLETEDFFEVTSIKMNVNGVKVGFIVGLAMCIVLAILFVLLYIMNSSIRYENEVQEYLKVPVLGTISEVK